MKPVVLLSEPETRPDLKWVEEVAALLPEESSPRLVSECAPLVAYVATG